MRLNKSPLLPFTFYGFYFYPSFIIRVFPSNYLCNLLVSAGLKSFLHSSTEEVEESEAIECLAQRFTEVVQRVLNIRMVDHVVNRLLVTFDSTQAG
jgi:hypothetical protein